MPARIRPYCPRSIEPFWERDENFTFLRIHLRI
jgi:hypothetical protein